MSLSILAKEDRLSLGSGMHLRLLCARDLLEARREAHELAKSALEQPLCSNACLVAKALWVDEEETPLFHSGEEVLAVLTAEEIELLACRWDRFRSSSRPLEQEAVESGVNPNFDESRFLYREESQR